MNLIVMISYVNVTKFSISLSNSKKIGMIYLKWLCNHVNKLIIQKNPFWMQFKDKTLWYDYLYPYNQWVPVLLL